MGRKLIVILIVGMMHWVQAAVVSEVEPCKRQTMWTKFVAPATLTGNLISDDGSAWTADIYMTTVTGLCQYKFDATVTGGSAGPNLNMMLLDYSQPSRVWATANTGGAGEPESMSWWSPPLESRVALLVYTETVSTTGTYTIEVTVSDADHEPPYWPGGEAGIASAAWVFPMGEQQPKPTPHPDYARVTWNLARDTVWPSSSIHYDIYCSTDSATLFKAPVNSVVGLQEDTPRQVTLSGLNKYQTHWFAVRARDGMLNDDGNTHTLKLEPAGLASRDWLVYE